MRLKDRAAIVTGAASGIGRASAQLFAEEGALVLAVDVPTSQIMTAHDGVAGVTPLALSIADEGAPARIVGEAVAKFGRLDILFNNAGVSGRHFVEEMTDEQWERIMAVNVTAQMKLARAAIPHLKASPAARIINTASVMAEGTDLGLAAYCASKAGVAGLTRTLALELGRYNITANYLLPGAIETGMTKPLWDVRPDVADIWSKKSPLRRLGQPIDLARAALFLASDEASFITGHGLNVDGGLMLRV
ncbi:3-oxoacyl-[acyl-carrier-protein] reductase FabG [Alphaproteobacteria bacterium SO-S41]|nr:3-oxoacyl-[acyl-carrier-protein] reductase FabG [Alphaproteobacteria bacterium SO-S41]